MRNQTSLGIHLSTKEVFDHQLLRAQAELKKRLTQNTFLNLLLKSYKEHTTLSIGLSDESLLEGTDLMVET